MFFYYLKLAWLALKKHRNLSLLMIVAIGLGIGAAMTAITVLNRFSGNPIPHKNDVLYAVQLDSWSAENPFDNDGNAPDQLTYKDAVHLMENAPAEIQTPMFKTGMAVLPTRAELAPSNQIMRATGTDFFHMFEVPFKSGGPWTKADDMAKARVVVLTEALAQTLFGDEDAVGKMVTLNDEPFRVTGVLAPWRPLPKFFDVTNGALNPMESAYLPFTTAMDKELPSYGNNNCFANPGEGREGYLASDCIWIQYWAELPDAAARDRYLAFMNSYADAQQKLGRFPRNRNNHLRTVDEWLVNQEVVPSDTRVFAGVGLGFLLVCLINAVGLMLAKFLRRTGELAVRRALGASRRALFAQHLTEAGLIGLIGGLLGLAVTWAGLQGVRALLPNLEHLADLNGAMFGLLLLLAIGGTLLAGVYPALRACLVQPAANLKSN